MFTFDQLIEAGVSRRASDIHVTVGVPPMGRIDGGLRPLCDEKCTPAHTEAMAMSIMSESHREILARCGEVDFAYSIPGTGRYRLTVFRQKGDLAIAVRVLNQRIPDPDELGVPPAVVEMCQKKRGLVLVTGPTGSGKSTTLASLINIINHTMNHHIITMEDPIEYLHYHHKSIVNQREMGSDSANYASALRAALREDPDVLLVGEMRDLETISTAITAAETGHLVFSTLHTVGAANTIDRIVDVFPPFQQQQIRTQLADVLECVVSQQLLPRAGGKGRVAAIEVMLSNSAIRSHIRDSKTFQIASVMQTNRKLGMITMDEALLQLYQTGEITEESALRYAQDPAALRKRLF